MEDLNEMGPMTHVCTTTFHYVQSCNYYYYYIENMIFNILDWNFETQYIIVVKNKLDKATLFLIFLSRQGGSNSIGLFVRIHWILCIKNIEKSCIFSQKV